MIYFAIYVIDLLIRPRLSLIIWQGRKTVHVFSSQFEMSQKMFLRSLWCFGTLLKKTTKADVFIICFETLQSAMKKKWDVKIAGPETLRWLKINRELQF